jgi:xanthine dehydrogenase accessory factor
MQSSQHHIIAWVSKWLAEGKSVWLSTIIKTWGSSPRPVGAMMACTQDGELVGSISGGCIEEDFLQQLREGALKTRYETEKKPFMVHYGVSAEEQARLRLPCGGQLHVLLEFIQATPHNIDTFAAIDTALNQHQRISRRVDLITGHIDTSPESSDEAVFFSHTQMQHSLSPRYRLLLLGAGDVARYVAELALSMDYDVTLCDPRPDYLDNWFVPGVQLSSDLPDDLVRDQFSNPYSGIIALAHDPRVDDMALMEALKTDAFYIGAMGSERTSENRRLRLPELGLSEADIAKLHAPIGYMIGSKTPAEIAISILAEVTAVRHKVLA